MSANLDQNPYTYTRNPDAAPATPAYIAQAVATWSRIAVEAVKLVPDWRAVLDDLHVEDDDPSTVASAKFLAYEAFVIVEEELAAVARA